MAKIVRVGTAAEAEVHEAYRPRGKRSKVDRPRAVKHGYLNESVPEPRVSARREGAVERQLDALSEADPQVLLPAAEIYQAVVAATPVNAGPRAQEGAMTPARRQQYAALETRREIVATLLASGATEQEAADHAGISVTTVARYLEDDEFRARIRERTSLALGVVQGRIVGWMDRRTADPTALDAADPKIVLAIWDRTEAAGGSRRSVTSDSSPNVVVNTYNDFMGGLAGITRRASAQAAQPVDDASTEGGGFPLLRLDDDPVAGGSPSGD